MKNTRFRPCAQELSWCSSESLKLLLFCTCVKARWGSASKPLPQGSFRLMPLLASSRTEEQGFGQVRIRLNLLCWGSDSKGLKVPWKEAFVRR